MHKRRRSTEGRTTQIAQGNAAGGEGVDARGECGSNCAGDSTLIYWWWNPKNEMGKVQHRGKGGGGDVPNIKRAEVCLCVPLMNAVGPIARVTSWRATN